MRTKTRKPPTDAQLKNAYALWKQGGISVWGVKRATGILARVLLPAFQKLGTPAERKLLKKPTAKLPKPATEKAKAVKVAKEITRAA